jgi:hypothetical protein
MKTMSRTDLEQDGYNHNQNQKATDAAANDERQRVRLLIFQEDDSDLDKAKRPPMNQVKQGRKNSA